MENIYNESLEMYVEIEPVINDENRTTNFIDIELLNPIKDLVNPKYQYDIELWKKAPMLFAPPASDYSHIRDFIYSSLICNIIWNTSYYYNNLEYSGYNLTYELFEQLFHLPFLQLKLKLKLNTQGFSPKDYLQIIITHFKSIIDGFPGNLKYRFLIIYLEELFNYNLKIQPTDIRNPPVLSGAHHVIEKLSYSFDNNNNYKLEVEPFIKNVIKIILPKRPHGLEDEYLSEIYKVKEKIKAETPKKKRPTLKSSDLANARQDRAKVAALQRQGDARGLARKNKRMGTLTDRSNQFAIQPPTVLQNLSQGQGMGAVQPLSEHPTPFAQNPALVPGIQGFYPGAGPPSIQVRGGGKKRSKKYKKRSKKYKKTRKKRKTKGIQKKTKRKQRKKKTKIKRKQKCKRSNK